MKKKNTQTFGVIGLGRFGTALATTLAEAGREVVVIDHDEERVKAMRGLTEYAYVSDSLSKDTLSTIGIGECDIVAVCIGEQIDVSILTTLNVVSLGVPHVIAKAISPEHGAVLEKIGAEVIFPERDMAIRLGKRLLSNTSLDFIFLDNGIEIQQVTAGGHMIGTSVRDFNIRRRYGLNIIALERGGRTEIEISPDEKFAEGDIVTVIGRDENVKKFERDMA